MATSDWFTAEQTWGSVWRIHEGRPMWKSTLKSLSEIPADTRLDAMEFLGYESTPEQVAILKKSGVVTWGQFLAWIPDQSRQTLRELCECTSRCDEELRFLRALRIFVKKQKHLDKGRAVKTDVTFALQISPDWDMSHFTEQGDAHQSVQRALASWTKEQLDSQRKACTVPVLIRYDLERRIKDTKRRMGAARKDEEDIQSEIDRLSAALAAAPSPTATETTTDPTETT